MCCRIQLDAIDVVVRETTPSGHGFASSDLGPAFLRALLPSALLRHFSSALVDVSFAVRPGNAGPWIKVGAWTGMSLVPCAHT